jgi:glucose/arabinose dehydrogenase
MSMHHGVFSLWMRIAFAILATIALAFGRIADVQEPPPTPGLPSLHLGGAFPKLAFSRPIFLTHAGDGSNRIFVAEQTGRIKVFENRNDVEATSTFLDVREVVQMKHNEEGLLALAFHPKYKENGRFFVYYSLGKPKRNRVSEFRVSAGDPNKADPDSERIILDVEQKYGNHNGSTLVFGPDGYLYISHGDGGLANDPDDHGQSLNTLLGKITRIDIDKQDGGRPYAIPADNPFVDVTKYPDARREIWAYGLRNVWRMSFDRVTGDLWAGDVGQNAWEDVDLIIKGGNYGWNIREGKHDFAGGVVKGELIEPLAEYPHSEGLSITGGYVYRGSRFPVLAGIYIYADYATGRIWGLKYQNGKVIANGEMLSGRERTFIASFGEDEAGEVYACAFDRLDGRGGRIMRVIGHGN